MEIIAQRFDSALLNFGKLSIESVEEHLKLYQAYVANSNTILQTISSLESSTPGYTNIIGELHRRFSFEYNGVLNHEKFFEQFTGSPEPLTHSALLTQISEQWGSYESWKSAFITLAKTRGIGWAILYLDSSRNILHNTWVDEQHIGHLNSCDFIMGIDLWEHSFVRDYSPTGKAAYVTDAIDALDWSVILKRYLL
jgi:superoxide dismutase, Fe-Mn family